MIKGYEVKIKEAEIFADQALISASFLWETLNNSFYLCYTLISKHVVSICHI